MYLCTSLWDLVASEFFNILLLLIIRTLCFVNEIGIGFFCFFEEEKFSAFGKGKKATVLWNCTVLAIFWVVCQARNTKFFEDSREEEASYFIGKCSIVSLIMDLCFKRI